MQAPGSFGAGKRAMTSDPLSGPSHRPICRQDGGARASESVEEGIETLARAGEVHGSGKRNGIVRLHPLDDAREVVVDRSSVLGSTDALTGVVTPAVAFDQWSGLRPVMRRFWWACEYLSIHCFTAAGSLFTCTTPRRLGTRQVAQPLIQ
jgi:hypothetical protein